MKDKTGNQDVPSHDCYFANETGTKGGGLTVRERVKGQGSSTKEE